MARYQEQQAFRPVSGDIGESSRLNSLSQRLGGFGDQALNIHAEQRQAAAVKEASMMDPRNPELQNNVTVFGKAFDQTLITAHQAAIKSDYSLALERYATEHPDDPAAFEKLATGVRSEILGQALPEVKQMAGIGFDNLAGSYLNKIKSNFKDKELKLALNEQAVALDRSYSDMLRFVRNGDDKSAADEFAAYRELLSMSSLNPEEQEAALAKAQRGMIEQTYFDDIEALPVAEGYAYVEEMAKNVPEQFTPEEWDEFISTSKALVARKKAIADGQKVAATHEDTTLVTSYIKAREMGYNITDAERDAAYASAGRADKGAEIRDADAVYGFSLLSAADQDAVLASASGLENVNRVAGMKKARVEIRKQAEADGLDLMQKQGLADIVPFDGTPESFVLRQVQAAQASQHYGVEVAPLTKMEIESISDNLASGEMTIQDKMSMAAVFGDSPKVWEMFDDANANVFAMATANGNPDTMKAIFKGQELAANKLAPKISQKDYLPVFNDAVESVYEGRDRKTVLEAAMSHYYATAETEEFDSSAFEDSIQAVTGGIGKINGFKLQLPNGIPEDDFEQYIDKFKPEWIEQGIMRHSNGEAAEKIRNSKITSVGNNQYIVETEDGALFNKDGTPFILSFDPYRFSEVSGSGKGPSQKERRSSR